jgi:hypothetical protein
MRNGNHHDFEKRLKSIRLKEAPAGLREKILGTARQRQEATAWTTPLLRKCLAGCSVLLAVIFLADAGASRTQNARVQAILDGTRISRPEAVEQWNTQLEELRDAVGPGDFSRERWLQARQKIKPSRDPSDETW